MIFFICASDSWRVNFLELLTTEYVKPAKQVWLFPQYLFILLDRYGVVLVQVDCIENALQSLTVYTRRLSLQTVPVRHELLHYEIHFLEIDFTFTVDVKEAEAEFILFIDGSVLVNVEDGCEFL